MNDGLLIFLAIAGLLSIIVVVVVWQLASTWRAKATLVREGEYRQLGERAVTSAEQTLRLLETLNRQLADTSTRLASIERSLTVID